MVAIRCGCRLTAGLTFAELDLQNWRVLVRRAALQGDASGSKNILYGRQLQFFAKFVGSHPLLPLTFSVAMIGRCQFLNFFFFHGKGVGARVA